MKTTNILLLSVILVLSGCSLYNSITKKNGMKIVNAGYNKWSEPPVRGDVPEKGTDLAIIVKNWPNGASPSYVIHENWKSVDANISDTTDIGIIINARVVKATSVRNVIANKPQLKVISEQVDKSDRLVYADANGNTKHIEIEEWTRIEDTPSESD